MAGIIEVYYDGNYRERTSYGDRNKRNTWMEQQKKLIPVKNRYRMYFVDKPSEFYEKQYSQRNTPPTNG